MKNFLEYKTPKEEISETHQDKPQSVNILESFSKSYSTFQENLERASECIKQFEDFEQLKENLVDREELQTLLATQLILINDNINDVRGYIKGINQEDLQKLSKIVNGIQSKTDTLVTYVNEELPLAKKKIYETDFSFNKKLSAVEHALHETAKTIVEVDASTTEKFQEQQSAVKFLGGRIDGLTEHVNEEITKHIKDLYEEVSSASKDVTLLEEKYTTTLTPAVERIKEFQKEIESIKGISEQYNETIADAKKEIAQVINEVNQIFINDKYMELDRKVQQVNEMFESLNGKTKLNEEVPPASPVQMGMDAPQVANLTAKVRWLEQSLGRIIQTGPGSGEVNLRWLDDIDRSTIANGKFLRYNGTTKKFEFATVSGGGGGGVTSYNDLTDLPTLFSGSYTDLTNKPTIPAAQIQSDWNQSNTASLDYIKNKPTIPSLTGYATQTYVSTAINNLINSAPGTLDTLGEIATALQNDETAIGALTTSISSKIGLGSLSVSTGTASGSGSLTYNNTNGVFTFRPPVLFSGSYTDLTNKPSLFSGAYADLTGKPTLFSGAYSDLTGKPTLFSGSYNDLTDKPTLASGQIQSDWNQTNSGEVDYIKNKPVLFSGSYTDLTNKPSLFSGSYTDLTNKPTIPSLTGYATETYVTTQITNLINGAPTTLDTLKEIADQLANDESAVSALTSTVASKIGLTNLSVTTASASGSGALSYNNTSGVFTFTPALAYSLPTATGSVLGGIKVGTGLSIDGSGILSTTVAPGGNATFNNITTTGQIVETFQSYSTSIGATQPITLDCTGGNIFNITSTVTQNWTAAFTNLSLGTGKATNTTLIINQGATPYIPTAISVNGNSATINWQGGATPTGSASKKDVIAFSILQTGSTTFLVFGQLVSFG